MKLETAPVGESAGMAQIQAPLVDLTIELHNMKKGKVVREEVWCTRCKIEGHDKEQCPVLKNYLNVGGPNPFNNNVLYCEICRTTGQHRPEDCYLLQRYVLVVKNPYCKFCKFVGHNENECRSLNFMMERTHDAYRVQANDQGHEGYGHRGGRGNFRGRGHGGMPGRGR